MTQPDTEKFRLRSFVERLVQQAYHLHARIALRRSHGRCSRCRTSRQLQIHHRRYRSHGGTHEVDNLEPVCWNCHIAESFRREHPDLVTDRDNRATGA